MQNCSNIDFVEDAVSSSVLACEYEELRFMHTLLKTYAELTNDCFLHLLAVKETREMWTNVSLFGGLVSTIHKPKQIFHESTFSNELYLGYDLISVNTAPGLQDYPENLL